MTRYFAQNTPRAGLEHMMMSVPGFQKRGGGMMILSRFCYKPEDVDCRYCLHYRRRSCQVRTCPYIAERLKSGAIEYLDLILEYFGHIPHAGLHKRIQAVEHWSGPDQAVLHTVSVHLRSRFADRVWDDAPPGYLAALYLLASKERLWQPALPALSHDSIDFSRIVSKPHGFAIQDYPIFYSARRLYDLKSPMEAEDLAHPKLVSDLDFHGDGETYARHLRQGERAEPEGMIVHLNPTEQRTIIEALVEQQERQEQAMSQTEQLLRRMTGSITAYMDEVGRYPLHISDYDKTVLAIRDGEFDAFKNLYPRVSDQTDDLLIEVAGRPGVVGGNMTLILLAAVERFSPEAYLTACKRAVETGDSWRVQTLVKESEGRLSEPLPSLHGEVILYAYTNNCRNIAKDLIAQCTPEQIASVPPKLLRWVAEKLDFQTAVDLVDKGVRPGDEVAGILRTLTGQHQEWMAERLLEHGMPVEPDNYDALYACVSNQAVGAAKLLLDRGIDLEQYQLWAEHRPKGDGYTETMEELAAYWSELQNSTQPEDSPMKGMNL